MSLVEIFPLSRIWHDSVPMHIPTEHSVVAVDNLFHKGRYLRNDDRTDKPKPGNGDNIKKNFFVFKHQRYILPNCRQKVFMHGNIRRVAGLTRNDEGGNQADNGG